MKKGIVGKKIGMTQIFTEDGRLIPVTVIQAGPCPVVQKKTVENDGYEAIQVGFDAYAENRAEKLVNKPIKGHFAKANVAPCRKLRELRRLTSSPRATRLISPAPPRATASPARSPVGTSTPARWPTVPSIIAALVP